MKSSTQRKKHPLKKVSKEAVGLDFKNMEAFNKALLTKQLWRVLLKNPNSLVAQVLKQKYFKKTQLLNANIDHKPSHV